MTASSEMGRFLAFQASAIDADDPVDAGLVRDGIVNNLRHAYDGAFQPRVCWVSRAGIAPIAGNMIDYWRPLPHFAGTFPVHLRADGTAPKLVVRLAGRFPSGSGTARLRVWWRAFTGRPVGVYDPPPDAAPNVGEATITGALASAVWLDTAAAGRTALAPYVLELPAAEVAAARAVWETSRTDGAAVAVDVALTTLQVSARLDAGASGTPDVWGLYAREFVG